MFWRKPRDDRKVTSEVIDELRERIAFTEGMCMAQFALLVCLTKYLSSEQQKSILTEAREVLAKPQRSTSELSEAEAQERVEGVSLVLFEFAQSFNISN